MAEGKLFVVFDDAGTVVATAASAHAHAAISVKGGHRVHEMDHPGSSGEALSRHLADLHRNHRVELSDPPKLVKK